MLDGMIDVVETCALAVLTANISVMSSPALCSMVFPSRIETNFSISLPLCAGVSERRDRAQSVFMSFKVSLLRQGRSRAFVVGACGRQCAAPVIANLQRFSELSVDEKNYGCDSWQQAGNLFNRQQ